MTVASWQQELTGFIKLKLGGDISMQRTLIISALGQIYHNENGNDYRCNGYMNGISKMVRVGDS